MYNRVLVVRCIWMLDCTGDMSYAGITYYASKWKSARGKIPSMQTCMPARKKCAQASIPEIMRAQPPEPKGRVRGVGWRPGACVRAPCEECVRAAGLGAGGGGERDAPAQPPKLWSLVHVGLPLLKTYGALAACSIFFIRKYFRPFQRWLLPVHVFLFICSLFMLVGLYVGTSERCQVTPSARPSVWPTWKHKYSSRLWIAKAMTPAWGI